MYSDNREKWSLICHKRLCIGALIALFLPLASLASNPDISIRSWVEYPFQNSSSNFFLGGTSSYVDVTAVASSDRYALLGAGHPRLKTRMECIYIFIGCSGLSTHAEYQANPVYVIGPWDGSESSTLSIAAPNNALGVEEFGSSLAIQGSRIAVGASSVFSWDHDIDPQTSEITVTTRTTGAGQVHLYQINGAVISAERTVAYGGLEDRFGASLAMDAETLLVGRPGAVPAAADLFDPDTGTYITSLVSPGIGDGFATSVALAGDLAIIAAPDINTVYVYRHGGGGNWQSVGMLDSPGADSEFGVSVAADGERIIVGAPGIDRAYIYEDDGDSNWPVVAELAGAATSRLGTAVAIIGEVAFAAAPQLLYGPVRVGIVVRHEKLDGSWPFVGYANPSPSLDGDAYGTLISASATMLTAVQPGNYSSLPDRVYIHTGAGQIWDTDGDRVVQFLDNCRNVANTNQADFDEDGIGNACDSDGDNDGLSNQDEIIAGSDLFNPDTDGDGMLDGEDPEPLVSDLDRDGVGDDDEIAAGTDPLKPDTDDDGRNDAEDPFPLDPNDGWILYERLNIDHAELALGREVLLIRKSNGDVQAMRRGAREWEVIPAPTINGSPLPAIASMQMKGARAVFVEDNSVQLKYIFHVFDYDATTGWTWLATANTSSALKAFSHITDIAVDGDTVAAMVTSGGKHIPLVFGIGRDGIELLSKYPTAAGKVAVSGTTVAVGTRAAYNGEGAVVILSPTNHYVPQEVRRAPSVRGNGQYVGQDVSPARTGEFLVGSESGGFWLSNTGGNWQLTKLGIPPPFLWASRDYWLVGGGRNIVIHGLVDWLVYNGSDKSLLGTLRGKVNYSERPLTNGEIVVHGTQPHTGSDYIEIYHTALTVPPPGC